MNRRNHIQNELNGLNSNLLSEGNGTPFTIPDGYFEGFAASVLVRIKTDQLSASEEIAQLSPFLAGISRSMPFEVPHDYFQTNIEVLPAITSEEESLVLSFIDKGMPYEVPKGYFANLPEQALEKAEATRPKVVRMNARKWVRMAVAAMIAGIITVSGITYFNGSKTPKASTSSSVAVKEDLKKDLKTVSTEELDAFIKSTVAHNEAATARNTPKASEVKSLLKDVSDKELNEFLDQVPTDDAEEDIVL